MEANELEALRKQATTEGAEINREAVLKLINEYEAVVRAEEFWGVRGPKMAEELNALRTLEPQARAVVSHSRLVSNAAGAIEKALIEIDSLRAGEGQ